MEAIAGYLIINDLSARDYARRQTLPNQMTHDWFGQKCFRDSMPMGPWLTPAEFVPDPYDMSIKLWVNGELRQDGNSGAMLYPLAEQIAYLSRHLTLRPGDVISTGCPSALARRKTNTSSPVMRFVSKLAIAAFWSTASSLASMAHRFGSGETR
jgi:2-keto-4-pentenoate hydratase/2-oxohepta-3-ene-1,7-dioic acid hydratase in catechol pathway